MPIPKDRSAKHFTGFCCALLLLGVVFCLHPGSAWSQEYASFDLLEIQMQMRTLGILQRRGYYITEKRINELRELEREYTEDLQRKSIADFERLGKWVEEERKVQKQQKVAMEEQAIKWGMRIIDSAARKRKDGDVGAVREWREAAMLRVKEEIASKKNASAIAKYLISLGQQNGEDKHVKSFSTIVRKQIYRDGLKINDSLIEGLVKLEKERMMLAGSLKLLDETIEGMKLLETIKKTTEDPVGYCLDEAEKKAAEYIMANFVNVDEANMKATISSLRSITSSLNGLRNSYAALNSNRGLRQNPTALATAQKFLVIGSVCKMCLGVVQNFPLAEKMGPMIGVLEFYTDALLLVPNIAEKLHAVFEKRRQGKLGASTTDIWVDLDSRSTEEEPLRTSVLMEKYSLPLASAMGLPFPFYLNATAPIDPNEAKYIGLTLEEYKRLETALSSERILNAEDQVSWFDRDEFSFETMFKEKDAVLSKYSSTTYRKAIAELASEPLPTLTNFGNIDKQHNPLRIQTIVDLAKGKRVMINGKSRNADELDQLADEKISKLATETIIRDALDYLPDDGVRTWLKFKNQIVNAKLTFAPRQLLRLFNNYYQSSPREALFQKFLKRESSRRKMVSAGVPSVGIPIVHNENEIVADEKQRSTLKTTVLIKNVAPDKTVQAEVIWKSAAGEIIHRTPTYLKNGTHELTRSVDVSDWKRSSDKTVGVQVEIIAAAPQETLDFIINSVPHSGGKSNPVLTATQSEQLGLEILDDEARAKKLANAIVEQLTFAGEYSGEIESYSTEFRDDYLIVKGHVVSGPVVPEPITIVGEPRLCHGITYFKIYLKIHSSSRACKEEYAAKRNAIQSLSDFDADRIVTRENHPDLSQFHGALKPFEHPSTDQETMGHGSGIWTINRRPISGRIDTHVYATVFTEQYQFSVQASHFRIDKRWAKKRAIETRGKLYTPLMNLDEARDFCRQAIEVANNEFKD